MDVVNCEDGLLRARICMGPPPRQTRILTSQPSMERVGVLWQSGVAVAPNGLVLAVVPVTRELIFQQLGRHVACVNSVC